jgi:hypothetical protein
MSTSSKTTSAFEKGFTALFMAQQGCVLLIVNLFSCGFFGWSAYETLVAYQLEANGDTAPGMVIALDKHTIDGPSYAPIVEYVVAGQTYTHKSGNYSNPSRYSVGDELTVRYDIDHPETARIESSWLSRWFLPLLGVSFTVIGSLVYNVWAIRRLRRGEDIHLE